MIKVEVKNIKWDLDSKDKMEKLNLPTEYTFEIEDKNLLDDYDFVPDVLSDKFGFCVESCTYNLLD
jgi:hypothetical protein